MKVEVPNRGIDRRKPTRVKPVN